MIRLLRAIPDIIEMLLHSPLAGLGDFGVIDLNFVDSLRPLRRKDENRRSPQPGNPFSKVAAHKSRIPALIDTRRICLSGESVLSTLSHFGNLYSLPVFPAHQKSYRYPVDTVIAVKGIF